MLGAAMLGCVGANAQTGTYTVTNIVTNTRDPHLVNPWGLSRAASKKVSPNQWWVSDQVTGLSTLYEANGTITKLVVTIPPATGTGPGSPTGTAAYNVGPTNVNFAFVTLDGTISYWDSQTDVFTGPGCASCHLSTATIMVNHNSLGASYQGLTIAKNATSGAETFYVANNVTGGGVEAYDAASFAPVTLAPGAFKDPKVPKTYAPAGIQAIGSKIYVLYNAVAGGGTGYVTAFSTTGKVLSRLQNGWFNQPWGIALAPADFGTFSSMLLVGNTGSGWIGAYNPTNGTFQGFLQSGTQDLTIPGLWGIQFGNGSASVGPTNVLYFNGGGVNQTTGVFGAITAN